MWGEQAEDYPKETLKYPKDVMAVAMLVEKAAIMFKDLEKWCTDSEGQFLERKSRRVAPKDLAAQLSAMANASGGTVVVGIEDDGTIDGINEAQENCFRQAAMDYLEQMPEYEVVSYDYDPSNGLPAERVLAFLVKPSHNTIIKTRAGEAYLRVGDHSRRLSVSQLLELEYARGTRSYEATVVQDAEMEDLDFGLIEEYAQLMDPVASEPLDLLRGRGLIRKQEGTEKITVAGLLLFGKNPSRFLPAARVRLLRYEGTQAGVGTRLNIVRDVTLESALPQLLRDGQRLLESQMREFQHLSREGVFVRIPEFPPFTWLEGLVNAVIHRDYSIQGEYTRIAMFDDRMEITSPGAFPGIVTVDNIQNTRFSRNPMIARVLGDFGWVRELNEGVKRIYQDMQAYFLDPPIYRELDKNAVQLILKNNIASRAIRKVETGMSALPEKWADMNTMEKEIIYYIANISRCTPKRLMELTGKTRPTITRYIRKLIQEGLVQEYAAAPSDPTKYYVLTATIKKP